MNHEFDLESLPVRKGVCPMQEKYRQIGAPSNVLAGPIATIDNSGITQQHGGFSHEAYADASELFSVR